VSLSNLRSDCLRKERGRERRLEEEEDEAVLEQSFSEKVSRHRDVACSVHSEICIESDLKRSTSGF
jgi:hypothetical protein